MRAYPVQFKYDCLGFRHLFENIAFDFNVEAIIIIVVCLCFLLRGCRYKVGVAFCQAA